MTRFCLFLIFLLFGSTANAALTVYNDLNQFLTTTGLTTPDGFEDLSTGIIATSFDRPGFRLSVVDPNTSMFNTNSGGTVVGNVRVGYSSTAPRSKFILDFDSPITAFGILLIDAPEDPDNSGSFDLLFFNDVGESLVAVTGPVVSESSVFFGVVKTDGVMQQVGFEAGIVVALRGIL